MEGVRVYGGKDLRKRYLLSLEWKRVSVTESDRNLTFMELHRCNCLKTTVSNVVE